MRLTAAAAHRAAALVRILLRSGNRPLRRGLSSRGVAFLILLSCFICLLPRSARAQFESCPFSPEAAVPDTLEPSGYYPLEIGYAWEYVRWSGCCLDRATRREVIGDTLIGGEMYRIVDVAEVFFDGATGDLEDTSSVSGRNAYRDYMTVRDGRLHDWEPDEGVILRRNLGRPFQSCHLDEETGTRTVVWSLPSAPFEVMKNGEATTFIPQAGKGMDVNGEQILYQYGLGYVSGGKGDTVEVLTYASLNDIVFGQPLTDLFEATTVGSDEQPATTFSLVNFPNPFAGQTQFELSLPADGIVTLQVIDMLGRRVDVPVDAARFASGHHRIAWNASHLASGVYFAQLVHNGQIVTTRSLVVAR